MKKIVAFLAAGAMLSVASAAFAADATGTIKAINTVTRTVTLDDGKVYTAIGTIDLTKVKVGDKVKVTFDPATPVFQATGVWGSATTIAPAT